jgi:5-methylcytosine-specific restriction enzyme A
LRNPKWHRDEIILALDLYFSPDRGSIDNNNPKIIEVSKILNALPIFPERPDEQRFRNENGVTLKLSNFLSFDPNYKGKGMTRSSKLDKIVFKEFQHDRDQLHNIASEIRKVVEDPILRSKVYEIEDDEETRNDTVLEGQVIYKLHKVRERDISIVLLKKKQALSKQSKLICEACVFEFEHFYGELGKGYIECHHRTRLANFSTTTTTSLEDLALVCSNCHRMLHRRIDTLTVEDLKMLIRYDRL